MKELFLTIDPIQGDLRDVDIPSPQEGKVLIKVIVTASNPKDFKAATKGQWHNQGDDFAGIVHSVGPKVFNFKKGDRVAAYHPMLQPHSGHAEYATAPAATTFLLPSNISFEEGATIPMCVATAAFALYPNLKLQLPWEAAKGVPVLIYGASSNVGAFALKLAKLSGHFTIAVAGSGVSYAKSLGADVVVDYRGDVVDQIKKGLAGRELLHAFDAVSTDGSWKNILEVVPHDGRATVTIVGPPNAKSPWTEDVKFVGTFVGNIHFGSQQDKDFGYVLYQYVSLLLADGRFSGHPYEVLGGLEEVARGTQLLFDNKVSSKKLVYRVAESEEV